MINGDEGSEFVVSDSEGPPELPVGLTRRGESSKAKPGKNKRRRDDSPQADDDSSDAQVRKKRSRPTPSKAQSSVEDVERTEKGKGRIKGRKSTKQLKDEDHIGALDTPSAKAKTGKDALLSRRKSTPAGSSSTKNEVRRGRAGASKDDFDDDKPLRLPQRQNINTHAVQSQTSLKKRSVGRPLGRRLSPESSEDGRGRMPKKGKGKGKARVIASPSSSDDGSEATSSGPATATRVDTKQNEEPKLARDKAIHGTTDMPLSDGPLFSEEEVEALALVDSPKKGRKPKSAIPSHRARAAKPLVKLVDDRTEDTGAANAISIKARFLARREASSLVDGPSASAAEGEAGGNTVGDSLNGKTDGKQDSLASHSSTLASGSGRTTVRSATKLQTRKSSLLTFTKGKLTIQKGRYNTTPANSDATVETSNTSIPAGSEASTGGIFQAAPGSTAEVLTEGTSVDVEVNTWNSIEDATTPEDFMDVDVPSTDPAPSLLPVHPPPSADELLQLAGLQPADADDLPDFEPDAEAIDRAVTFLDKSANV